MTKEEAIRIALGALGPKAPKCCGCKTEWEIAITALRQALKHPASILEGWKLVPIKPTQAMLDEMNLTGREGYDDVMGDGFSASLYQAALIASPVQPKAKQDLLC